MLDPSRQATAPSHGVTSRVQAPDGAIAGIVQSTFTVTAGAGANGSTVQGTLSQSPGLSGLFGPDQSRSNLVTCASAVAEIVTVKLDPATIGLVEKSTASTLGRLPGKVGGMHAADVMSATSDATPTPIRIQPLMTPPGTSL